MLATSMVPLLSLSPGEKQTLQGTHHHMLEVPGELEEPQPRSKGSYVPFLEQVPSQGQQEAQGLRICPPTPLGGGRWGTQSPLSSNREAASSPPSRAQDSQGGRGLQQLG